MPRAVIIDDEFHARENLRLLLAEYAADFEVVGEGQDIESGTAIIQDANPDVVFLDIRMPSGEEGFQLLDKLGPIQSQVVFVTAFKDYAIEAFKVEALDYLLKPIDIDELEATIERVRKRSLGDKTEYLSRLERLTDRLADKDSRLAIHHSRGINIVDPAHILYLEAQSNCTRLHFKDGTSFLDTRTLRTYEVLLNTDRFMRIHRSYIISLEAMNSYSTSEGPSVELSNGQMISVSKSYKAQLLTWIHSNSRGLRSKD